MEKLDALSGLLVLYGIMVFLNAVLSGILWWTSRNQLYRTLFLAWVGYVTSFVVQGAVAGGESSYQQVMALAITFLPMLMLGGFTAQLTKRKMHWMRYVGAFAFCSILTTGLALMGFELWIMGPPVIFAAAAPPILEGVRALSRRKELPFVMVLYIVIAALTAIHLADYPFFRYIPGATLPSFALAFILAIGTTTLSFATAMEVLATENARIRVENEIELKMAHSAKLATLGEMAGGVAHEVNSPLAAIATSIASIEGEIDKVEPNQERLHKHVKIIKNTTQRISSIVKALLTYSRKDSAGVETVSSSEILDLVLPIFIEKFSNEGIEIKVARSEEKVSCDAQQIAQVLVNLLNNAYDAVKGLEKPRVEIRVSRLEDYVLFEVIDNGSGIDEEVRSRLFDPFFTTKPVGKGTGMGLSLSKNLVEANGGKLSLGRDLKETRFELMLPSS